MARLQLRSNNFDLKQSRLTVVSCVAKENCPTDDYQESFTRTAVVQKLRVFYTYSRC